MAGISDLDVNIIRDTALFRNLGPSSLDGLLRDATMRKIEAGELIFLHGEPASAFFVVLEGWIKVFRISPGGDETIVGIFTRGQSFAEAAAFTGGLFPASGEAVTEARLMAITARHLFDHIRANPEIGLSMLASTSQHLHMLVNQIEQLKAHTGAQRIAEFLVELANVEDGPCEIVLPYDKALIAGRLGMKPESLSRAFHKLRSYGVTINQAQAHIADLNTLRDFAESERAEVMRGH